MMSFSKIAVCRREPPVIKAKILTPDIESCAWTWYGQKKNLRGRSLNEGKLLVGKFKTIAVYDELAVHK